MVTANGIEISVSQAGSGPAVLLLHGWPHTKELWVDVISELEADHRVIAPDLRGLGASDKSESGYDLHTLVEDAVGLLDALEIGRAAIVGIDLGAPVAWMAAVRHADRFTHLCVMESLLGALPGAEAFLAGGPPWWFGFHAVPGLPEQVLDGRIEAYIDWFLRAGTYAGHGVPAAMRETFVAAYADARSLHCGFEHYRALRSNAELVASTASGSPLQIPTLALGGNTVGDALGRQLRPITTDLTTRLLPECGHIIPADAPVELAAELRQLLATPSDRGASSVR